MLCAASVAARDADLLLEVPMHTVCICACVLSKRRAREIPGGGGGTLAPAPREQNTLGLRGGALIFKCGSSAITARIVTH